MRNYRKANALFRYEIDSLKAVIFDFWVAPRKINRASKKLKKVRKPSGINKIAINHFVVPFSHELYVNDFGNGNFIDLIRMLALYYFSIRSIQLKSLLFFGIPSRQFRRRSWIENCHEKRATWPHRMSEMSDWDILYFLISSKSLKIKCGKFVLC